MFSTFPGLSVDKPEYTNFCFMFQRVDYLTRKDSDLQHLEIDQKLSKEHKIISHNILYKVTPQMLKIILIDINSRREKIRVINIFPNSDAFLPNNFHVMTL